MTVAVAGGRTRLTAALASLWDFWASAWRSPSWRHASWQRWVGAVALVVVLLAVIAGSSWLAVTSPGVDSIGSLVVVALFVVGLGGLVLPSVLGGRESVMSGEQNGGRAAVVARGGSSPAGGSPSSPRLPDEWRVPEPESEEQDLAHIELGELGVRVVPQPDDFPEGSVEQPIGALRSPKNRAATGYTPSGHSRWCKGHAAFVTLDGEATYLCVDPAGYGHVLLDGSTPRAWPSKEEAEQAFAPPADGSGSVAGEVAPALADRGRLGTDESASPEFAPEWQRDPHPVSQPAAVEVSAPAQEETSDEDTDAQADDRAAPGGDVDRDVDEAGTVDPSPAPASGEPEPEPTAERDPDVPAVSVVKEPAPVAAEPAAAATQEATEDEPVFAEAQAAVVAPSVTAELPKGSSRGWLARFGRKAPAAGAFAPPAPAATAPAEPTAIPQAAPAKPRRSWFVQEPPVAPDSELDGEADLQADDESDDAPETAAAVVTDPVVVAGLATDASPKAGEKVPFWRVGKRYRQKYPKPTVEQVADANGIVIAVEGGDKAKWHQRWLRREIASTIVDPEMLMVRTRQPARIRSAFVRRLATGFVVLLALAMGAVFYGAISAGSAAEEASASATIAAGNSAASELPRSTAEFCTSLYLSSTSANHADYDAQCQAGQSFPSGSGGVSASVSAYEWPLSILNGPGDWSVLMRVTLAELRQNNETGQVVGGRPTVQCMVIHMTRGDGKAFRPADPPRPALCPQPGDGVGSKAATLATDAKGTEPVVQQATEYVTAYLLGRDVQRFWEPSLKVAARSIDADRYAKVEYVSASYGIAEDESTVVRLVLRVTRPGGAQMETAFFVQLVEGTGGLWYVTGSPSAAPPMG